MARVKALVIAGCGTNSDKESAYAARQAGADEAELVFFSDLIAGRTQLPDFNYLILPGGFLDGDDLGSAQAAALRWRYARTSSGHPLVEYMREFLSAGGLVLGICNGFQLLAKLGLLPALGGAYFERQASLSHNDSARYEDRWVTLKPNPASPCVFTRGLGTLDVPVRHGEGKVVFLDEETERRTLESNLVALYYVHPATGSPTQEYPFNPNGSPHAIAGLTDPSGRILGLMPHPEAFNHRTNHPDWTRGYQGSLGIELLAGGVRCLREQ